jgi:hypothetical protein
VPNHDGRRVPRAHAASVFLRAWLRSGLSQVQMFFSVPAATGTGHRDLKTGPLTACRQKLLTDEPFTVMQDHLGAGGPADANDPNILEGEEVQLSPDKRLPPPSGGS